MLENDHIRRLFPTGKLVRQPEKEGGAVCLPLADGGWLSIPADGLTEREQCLLGLFLREPHQAAQPPWLRFLKGEAPSPERVECLQLIQVHLWSEADEETVRSWLDMMATLLPNQKGMVQRTTRDYLFFLEQELLFDVGELLAATLSAMEIDFGLRMTVFVGQVWPVLVASRWPQLLQSEQTLFATWLAGNSQVCLVSLAQVYLWAMRPDEELEENLKTVIAQQQMEEVIVALWQAGAVLTKTAQSLYIHRNTLQYRLDKWWDLTGLDLKKLTDLSLCYQVLMRQTPFYLTKRE